MRESVWVCGAGGALQASQPEVAMQPSHQNSPNSVCLSVYVCSCVPLCGKMCCGFAVRETRKHAGYCIPFRSLTGKRNDAYDDDGRTVRCDWKLPAYKSQTVKIIIKKTGTARVRWKTEAVEQEVRWRVYVWWKTGGIKTVVVTRGAISLTSLPPSWNAYCCCFIKLIGVIVFGACGLVGCVGFVFTSHCFWGKECAYSLDCCGVAGVLRVLIDGWWFSNLTICLSVRLAPPFFEQ